MTNASNDFKRIVARALFITGVLLAYAQNGFYAQEATPNGNAAKTEKPGSTRAESKTPTSTPEEFVDALNSAFGKQTTQRATHAKGVVLQGKFTPSATARTLSIAPHFLHAVTVTVRFSDNTGIPMLADAAPLARPYGMAIKFHLPDGTETDLVTHSFNGFPTASVDEQRVFFIAVGLSGPGAAKPTPIEKFMETHPAAKAFLTTQDPPPVSYATLAYFGVNSFSFTNAEGQSTFGRYQIIPEAGKHLLSPAETASAGHDYLVSEIRQRVSKGPIRFTLRLQLPAPGDKIEDPSVAWSDNNKVIDLGVIEIISAVPDNEATEGALLFMPGLLPAGIKPADPMIQFRNKAYPVSYERRHQ